MPPNPDRPLFPRCVTLDPELKDSHGIPTPRIKYGIGETTRRIVEHGIARTEDILTACTKKNSGRGNLSVSTAAMLLWLATDIDTPLRQ